MTVQRKSRRHAEKKSVRGSPDSQNQPRSRRRMMRPLAKSLTDREHFNRDRLQNSIIKYYIIIYSEFQELGGCSHKVISPQSGAVMCTYPDDVAHTTHCSHVEHYKWKYAFPKNAMTFVGAPGGTYLLKSCRGCANGGSNLIISQVFWGMVARRKSLFWPFAYDR
jgi:hypothetical protein